MLLQAKPSRVSFFLDSSTSGSASSSSMKPPPPPLLIPLNSKRKRVFMDPDVIEIPPPQAPVVSRSHSTEQQKNKQDCYPERLGKLFIVHVPYIFMTAWKVVYPFIDSKTKRKIIFVENKKLKSTLLGDIDESQLPDVYGGKLSLVPIQDD